MERSRTHLPYSVSVSSKGEVLGFQWILLCSWACSALSLLVELTPLQGFPFAPNFPLDVLPKMSLPLGVSDCVVGRLPKNLPVLVMLYTAKAHGGGG